MAGGNGRQRKAVTPTQPAPAKATPAKKPDSAGGNGKQREKK